MGLTHYQILAAPLDDCLTQLFAEIPETSPELLAHLCYTLCSLVQVPLDATLAMVLIYAALNVLGALDSHLQS